jgi:hypothetical protein
MHAARQTRGAQADASAGAGRAFAEEWRRALADQVAVFQVRVDDALSDPDLASLVRFAGWDVADEHLFLCRQR